MPPAPTISTFRNERGVIQGAASVRPGATPHRQRASRLRTNSLFARRAEALPLLRAPLRVHAGAVMASDVWRAPVPSKRARGHAAARAFRGDSPTHDRAHLAPQSRLPASAPPHPAHVSRVDNKPPPVASVAWHPSARRGTGTAAPTRGASALARLAFAFAIASMASGVAIAADGGPSASVTGSCARSLAAPRRQAGRGRACLAKWRVDADAGERQNP